MNIDAVFKREHFSESLSSAGPMHSTDKSSHIPIQPVTWHGFNAALARNVSLKKFIFVVFKRVCSVHSQQKASLMGDHKKEARASYIHWCSKLLFPIKP